jgi:hypothetical protein
MAAVPLRPSLVGHQVGPLGNTLAISIIDDINILLLVDFLTDSGS